MKYQVSLDKVKFSFNVRNILTVKRWVRSLIDGSGKPNNLSLRVHDFSLDRDRWINRVNAYLHSYSFCLADDDEGVFYIAFTLSGGFKGERPNHNIGIIEYNPNKRGAYIYKDFCDNVEFTISAIRSCDVAFDFRGVAKNTLSYDTPCHVMHYGFTSNTTSYIAPKASNGRVKVYQKDIERGDNDIRTRVEVSCVGEWLNSLEYINNEVVAEHLSACCHHLQAVKFPTGEPTSTNPTLYMLQCLNDEHRKNALALMGKQASAKYRKLLRECGYIKSLDFTIAQFADILADLLRPYPTMINPSPRLSTLEKIDKFYQTYYKEVVGNNPYHPLNAKINKIEIEGEFNP